MLQFQLVLNLSILQHFTARETIDEFINYINNNLLQSETYHITATLQLFAVVIRTVNGYSIPPQFTAKAERTTNNFITVLQQFQSPHSRTQQDYLLCYHNILLLNCNLANFRRDKSDLPR